MAHIPPQAYTRDILMAAYDWYRDQPPTIQKVAANPDVMVSLYLRSRRSASSSTTGASPATSLEQDAPVSAQMFKDDLKKLSKGLEAFVDTHAGPAKDRAIRDKPVDSREPAREPTAMGNFESNHSGSYNLSDDSYFENPHYAQDPSWTDDGLNTMVATARPPSAPLPTAPPQRNVATDPNIHSPSRQIGRSAPNTSLRTEAGRPPAASAGGPSALWQGRRQHHAVATPPISAILDGQSLELVRQVRYELNLSTEAEALRLLVNMGFKRLRPLMLDSDLSVI